MTLQELQDYTYWVGKTPQDVLTAVRDLKGGWATVFPGKLPLWAHRIRNFFNREPAELSRFDRSEAEEKIDRIRAKYTPRKIPEKHALAGDVYKDDANWIWYRMSDGGNIYHWGAEPLPLFVKPEAFWQEVKSSRFVGMVPPVFKLVAPDGTGGSRETIYRNLNRGHTVVQRVKFMARVAHMTVFDSWHGGSYNYSETISVGFDAHNLRDVDPHNEYQFEGVYVNPPDNIVGGSRRSLLKDRVFPERAPKDDPTRHLPLAQQLVSRLK